MLPYVLSAGVGLIVGVAYALVGVRSPAPPIIALVGLLGMLFGEAAVNWLRGHPEAWSWACHSKSFVADKPTGAVKRALTTTVGSDPHGSA